jgi:hypothetical protein
MNILIEAVGWTGAVFVLVGYALLAMKKLNSHSYAYHGMNIIGAFLLAWYAVEKNANASVAINAIWTCIGISAVVSIWRNERKQP